MHQRINNVLTQIQEKNTLKLQLEREQKLLEKEISDLNSEVQILDKVAELFKFLLDEMILDNVKKVENLVTYGLKVVFPDQDLKFEGIPKHGKGTIGIEFKTVKDSQIVGDVIESFGGSLAVVESFLLRLITITKMSLYRLLILDESFAEVDPEYSLNVSLLLKEMCEKLNFDILLVTFNNDLLEHAHNVFKVVEDLKTNSAQIVRVR